MVPETIRKQVSKLGLRGVINTPEAPYDLYGHTYAGDEETFTNADLPPGVTIAHVEAEFHRGDPTTWIGLDVDVPDIVVAPFAGSFTPEFGANVSDVKTEEGHTHYLWAFEGTEAADRLRESSYATKGGGPRSVIHRDHTYEQIVDG